MSALTLIAETMEGSSDVYTYPWPPALGGAPVSPAMTRVVVVNARVAGATALTID